MYIKLKNKKEICVYNTSFSSEVTCQWCGKTIKKDKPHFYGGGVSYACSAAHVKAAANAAL
jgi:ribosomal protein S27E